MTSFSVTSANIAITDLSLILDSSGYIFCRRPILRPVIRAKLIVGGRPLLPEILSQSEWVGAKFEQ